ncbi:MAG TPA: UDP-N-acetylmuramoyl-tripeptide--D-alanyl-D-alanine ligase [Acidimicrobiia bacterium]|nr:UDP-N-acetylmuramoyl-tripeptide--D-alanyl-D-alanine ligase [Acidimicrobiia bacterium]
MIAWLLVPAAVGAVLSAVRWLRVAQREHYLAGSATRFAIRWWRVPPVNLVLFVIGMSAGIAGFWWPAAGIGAMLAAAIGPVGLGLRGRTSPLRWTARMRRLAVLTALLAIGVTAAALPLGAVLVVGSLVAILLPLLLDLALWLLAPLERRLGRRFVDHADARLRSVAPLVVAITGSYGKTTTKEYLRSLLSTRFNTVATPASFNNAMGLARTINEQLSPGVEVFVAEMGTYGPGEIADLVSWVQPRVAVITAIGPVHLERFGSLEATTRAKQEILATADVAVLNVDDARLAELAETFSGRVVRCSSLDSGADVMVQTNGAVCIDRNRVATVDSSSLFAGNLACAVGAALAVGMSPEEIGAAAAALAGPDHRRTVVASPGVVSIVDDTYNANPAGAVAALETLAGLGENGGRRVVVTPGMVELGARQQAENEAFARAAVEVASDLIVVGQTNRVALLKGAAGSTANVVSVATRDEAVAWARSNLRDGDAVLYENDLPDHYP